MGLMNWLTDPMGTGANNGQKDPKLTPSRWFDLGNSRVDAEAKNLKHLSNKERKQAEKDAKLRASKKGFFY